jgi:hypothetical protein
LPANEDNSDNDVGYRKPPSRGRFRIGISGNPKGRPRGKRNTGSVLERTLQEKVVINENGTRKKVTKLEAACKQLINKAASGDMVAIRLLTALSGAAQTEAVDTRTMEELNEFDKKTMDGVFKRFSEINNGGKNENQ